MATALVLDPEDQRRRRRRARVTQAEIAKLLDISEGAVSEYENRKAELPHELSPEDYELALAKAIVEKSAGSK